MTGLKMQEAEGISTAIQWRQEHFDDESLHTSIMVILFGFGDEFTTVECIGGEWSGVKKDLERTGQVPLCSNGHPLLEGSGRRQLALVEVSE